MNPNMIKTLIEELEDELRGMEDSPTSEKYLQWNDALSDPIKDILAVMTRQQRGLMARALNTISLMDEALRSVTQGLVDSVCNYHLDVCEDDNGRITIAGLSNSDWCPVCTKEAVIGLLDNIFGDQEWENKYDLNESVEIATNILNNSRRNGEDG